MAEPKVTAETNIGAAKTRKPRVVKAKPTGLQQAFTLARSLSMQDRATLVKTLRDELFADRDKKNVEAKEADALVEGI